MREADLAGGQSNGEISQYQMAAEDERGIDFPYSGVRRQRWGHEGRRFPAGWTGTEGQQTRTNGKLHFLYVFAGSKLGLSN